ncbi:MAG: DUF167 domain-containing protein [Candidatus Gastranaerophilales bacterium]|nr:DUF167 domain-containing protein [Candidatus Gastranaerophilales bacterium]
MDFEDNIKYCDNGIILKIRILPNSAKNRIVCSDDIIKIKITAQPIENKANKAIAEYLSKLVKVPKTRIKIIKGETSKDKTILIETDDLKKKDEIKNILINNSKII